MIDNNNPRRKEDPVPLVSIPIIQLLKALLEIETRIEVENPMTRAFPLISSPNQNKLNYVNALKRKVCDENGEFHSLHLFPNLDTVTDQSLLNERPFDNFAHQVIHNFFQMVSYLVPYLISILENKCNNTKNIKKKKFTSGISRTNSCSAFVVKLYPRSPASFKSVQSRTNSIQYSQYSQCS